MIPAPILDERLSHVRGDEGGSGWLAYLKVQGTGEDGSSGGALVCASAIDMRCGKAVWASTAIGRLETKMRRSRSYELEGGGRTVFIPFWTRLEF